MVEEIWKIIDGYNNYSISNLGNVFNNIRNKQLSYGKINTGYLYVDLWFENKRKRFLIHRLVARHFFDEFDDKQKIDHIDRNKLNNRIDNLRHITHSNNIKNANKRLNTTSKYKGVSFIKSINKWRSRITIDKKIYYLGNYETEKEAATAYNNFILNTHNKYFILNQIEEI